MGWHSGVKLTKEHKDKIRKALKGRIRSEEHRKNFGLARRTLDKGNGLRECCRCRIIQPISEFYFWKRKTNIFGGKYDATCRKCKSVKNKKYIANPVIRKRKNLYQRTQRKLNPEKARLLDLYRRMRERGGGTLPIQRIQMIYEDNIKHYGTLTCYLCKQPIPFSKDHLEHKLPLSRGGTNAYDNLAIACQHCNLTKHNKTEKEFLNVC